MDTTYLEVAFESGSRAGESRQLAAVAGAFGISGFGVDGMADHEVPCGILHDGVGNKGPFDVALQSVGVPFRAWEAPRYDTPGSLSLWTLPLGLWRGPCDSFGRAILIEDRVPATVESAAGDLLPGRWAAAFNLE